MRRSSRISPGSHDGAARRGVLFCTVEDSEEGIRSLAEVFSGWEE